ncbi:MAG TPA: 50S ribosomal protein L25 [Syntrophorhabdaceae bacterium]|nr:50S ribosomal protein L25 [Syntrophorhabdaceae bacterium]HOD74927.1 50S ribosomal protein L25 [Syntrophorhabdaceae bacterium]
MEQVLIKADRRSATGKGVARKARAAGRIPAVLYGGGVDPVSITISSKDWDKITRHMKRNVILDMEIHGADSVESRPVMVKEVQRNGLGTEIMHIDFLQVSMEKTVEVEVSIHLKGKSKGEVLGGVIDVHLRSIKVECLPGQIPEEIVIDMTELDIGDSVHVSDISLPGVKLIEHGDVAILSVVPPTVEEKRVATEEAAAEASEAKEKEE